MYTDCPDDRLEPREDVAIFECECCGAEIWEGDIYYRMPGSDIVCEDCLTDWARVFERRAECEDGRWID